MATQTTNSIGSYKGTAITGGSDASISAQVAAIDKALSAPKTAAVSAGSTLNSGASGGSAGVGAVNAKGELVSSSGKIIGMANPADRYSPNAKQATDENGTDQLAFAPTQKIDTTQPSPQNANATPFTAPTVPYDQAVQNLRSSGAFKGIQLSQMESSLADTYRKAGMVANSSGVPAPQNAGAGFSGAQQFLGATSQPQEPQSQMTFAEELDPQVSKYLMSYDDFNSPESQHVSLVDQYQELSKSLGLDNINTDLINTKKIIDGTEDDIRNEITAAGGTATESQVMAMANSRNKQLIKNYNYLLDTKNAVSTQLNTLMDLSIADRNAAEAEFDRKINFAFKVADFQQRATDNARQTYMTLGDKLGWDTLLTSSSPHEQSLIGKTLGLNGQQLNQLAIQSQQDRQTQSQENALRIEGLKLDNAKKAGDLTPGTSTTLDGKPQTASQLAINGYADRLVESDKIINSLGQQFTTTSSIGGLLPSFLQSGDRQLYEQAKRNFINAVLRKESGAAISPDEFSSAEKQYFPSAGDKASTIQQKADNRNTVINNLYREANINRPVYPGEIIESGGKKFRVDQDGETLIPI